MFHYTVKLSVGLLLSEGAGSEVYELEAAGVGVDDEVLVLDVPVHHAQAVALRHRGHHLHRYCRYYYIDIIDIVDIIIDIFLDGPV